MITKKVLKTLEYDKILEQLKKFAGSEKAKNDIDGLQPAVVFGEAERLLKETAEADKLLYEYALNLSFSFDDITFVLERAEKMSLLTMDEILKVGRLLRVSRTIKTALSKIDDADITLLKEKSNLLFTDKALEDKILNSIISAYEMSDNASYELKAIRHRIKKCNEDIRAKLSHYITSAAYQKYLQDNIITVRDNRHVILVKSEFKGMIPGLVHGQSATGSTLYVEPMSVFEMNNRLKALLSDEAFETERILREFTALICTNCGFIKYGFELTAALDTVFAKAAYAKSINAVRPNINGRRYTSIIKGRHPLIDAGKVVPISLSVGKEYNILMITGPNTGGKTVTLKLTGLLTLMAQSGLFIPAHCDSDIGVFEGIYSDIGDEQSIEQSLSTFSSHITNIVNILEAFDDKSLLLLDELGAGTDPTEGAALALAVTAHIKEKGARAIITTHYNELKEFSLTEDKVENASMDFDPETFAPSYHLIIGVPGASNAIKIAERLGLKPEIIARADGAVGGDRKQFENIIISAENARKKALINLEAAERERAEALKILADAERERNKLEQEREKFNQNIKSQAKLLIENAASEAAEIIEEMKILQKRNDEAAIFEARKLKKRIVQTDIESEAAPKNREIVREEGEIKLGDPVYVISLKTTGTAAEISRNGILVKIGALKTHVKKDDVYKIKPEKVSEPKKTASVNLSKPLNTEIVPYEINLLGKNIDEALYLVENFIDRAVTGGLSEVRIIHGVGTGKLGRAVQEYLKGHRNAASYRFGRYGEGERGVTVLTLK
ncbi:MAG: endonuclease MutS2 [Clostridiales bacterium]|jgi:DNA mismatch repair protein MutS2|nr:endonuclease MutS2 [Clostridiales bacterium]